MTAYNVTFYNYWQQRKDITLTVFVTNKRQAIGQCTQLVHQHGGFGTAAVITKIKVAGIPARLSIEY